MSHKDVQGRRLNLRDALLATARAMPRLWLWASGVLVAAVIAWVGPLFVALDAGIAPLTLGAAAVLTLMAVGALARLSISADAHAARALGLGPLGFQFGWPEPRLVGAALLCLIFLGMIVAMLGLVVLAIAGVAELDVAAIQARDWGAVGPAWKLAVLIGVGVGALLIPLLLAVRLSLFVPATLGRRQMVSLNSMGIAYGSFWQILGGLIVTAAPSVAVAILTGAGMMTGPLAEIIRVVVLCALQLPLTLGFLGAAYRRLEYWSPEEGKA
ncbi:hypothetical protein HZ989_12115 [Brevundimonas sp. AJA228-03]|uniref:hypothetical protein n=1 Tax=Brevundimonas sp. AJA228-03 TaxID=2752515 RepID=UPI001ADEC792|nr:hypothetical protein [Brevundimonas sp. AJA228-03]QTN18971.1 hypothetical protein HZ989_12115 [Brevundimonas sp. AJA228-03]